MEAREPGEVRERGVGREDEDHHRRSLQHEVRGVPERARTVDGLADLGEDRAALVGDGDDAEAVGQPGDADERGAEERAHPGQGDLGVPPFGLAERRDPVRDRLDPRDGGAAGGERAEDHEQPDRRRAEGEELGAVGGERVELARQVASEPDEDREEQARQEEVGGEPEDPPGLPDPEEVPVGEERDEGEGDPHPVPVDGRSDGAERLHPGRHRDGHGEDVVDEQRDAGDLRGQQAEVVPGDDVGPAGGRVGLDRLAVGEDQDGLDQHHRSGDREDEREGRRPDHGHEDAQDLLGRVRDRGQVVRREDGERRRLAEPLVFEPLRGERGPEEEPLRGGEADPGRAVRHVPDAAAAAVRGASGSRP